MMVIGLAAFPALWLALFARRRDPLHAVVLAAGFLSFACSLFDARFLATWHVLFAATLAIVVGAPPFETRVRDLRLAAAAFALVLLAPGARAHFESARLRAEVEANHVECARALEWLRDNAPSPGPFNHSEAPQDWCVLSAPALAGSIAYHARKPVFASSIDGSASANIGRAVSSSFLDDTLAAAREAEAFGAVFVVVTPLMRGDSRALAEFAGLLEMQAARGDAGARETAQREREQLKLTRFAEAGVTRVYMSERVVDSYGVPPAEDAPAGPLISIWRLRAPAVDHESQLSPAKH